MKRTILAITLLSSIAACSRHQETPQYQPQVAAPVVTPAAQVAAVPAAAAPVIVNQAPAAAPSSGVGDMLLGGAVGYMLGSSGNRSSTHAAPASMPTTRTVNRTTVINKTVIVKQTPAAKPKVNLSKSNSFRSSGFSSSRSGGRR